MLQRTLTGVIGGIFLAFVTYYGGMLYNFVYFGITCIAIYELSKVFFGKGFDYGAIINYFFAAAVYIISVKQDQAYFNFFMFLFIVLNFMIYIFIKETSLRKLLEILFIGFYVVFFMSHMILMQKSPFIWLIYIIAFGTDTFAYFTGRFFGRHKLYPQVSPNKTVEGAIGGIIGCVIISLLYFDYLRINKYIYIIIFSVCASIFSMVGDLVASKIKREYGIKDFGNCLPGHGGILDRFDSVLFVAPIVYYFINHFI